MRRTFATRWPNGLALAPWLVAVGLWSSVGRANDLGTFASEDGRYEALLATVDGSGWQLGRTTSVLVRLTPKVGADAATTAPLVGPPAPPLRAGALTFNASMPQHGHGTVLRPLTTQTAPDEFRLDGVKLHMAGDWQVVLDTTVDDAPVRFVIPVTL